jgi:DNA-binding transcriptional ArsR family regulator
LSIEAMVWALNSQGPETPTEKLVLVGLANHSGASWECWPSLATLAEYAMISQRQVRRVLRSLESQGLIERTEREHQTSLYRLIARTGEDTGDRGGRTPMSGGGGHSHVPRTFIEPSDEPSTPTHTRDLQLSIVPEQPQPQSLTFGDFWAVYPAKKDKGAAVRAWNRAVRRADPAVIVAAAERYRTSEKVRAGFVKYPATWLNADAWDDEPDEVRPLESARRQQQNEVLLSLANSGPRAIGSGR